MFARLFISVLHSAFWSACLDPILSRHWHGDALIVVLVAVGASIFLLSFALFRFAVDRLRECDEQ